LLTDVRSHALIDALWFAATLLNYSFALQACSVHVASDVTIIESEIEIEFFLENRIESKSIFDWYL